MTRTTRFPDRRSTAALAALLLLPLADGALAECRAPASCISCHAGIPNSPPPEVLEQIGPASCEVGDFTRGLNMSSPRFIHRTAKLADGRVLLTGGQVANAPASVITNSVDAFNPDDNSVAPVAPMTIRRWSHTATTLADGRVLVTGGRTASTSAAGVVLATAEIYDPASDTWTETAGPMNVARRSHTATLLPDGKVLIVGGGNGVSTTTSQPIASVESFDPATGVFTVVGNMLGPRSAHSAILLDDGTVLISGGSNGTGTLFPTNTAEIYDPATNSFTAVGPMNYPHLAQLPGRLRDGRVVQGSSYYNVTHTSAGGRITDESEIYDPAARTFTPVAPMFKPRIDIGAQGLLDGTLLIAGGVTTSPSFPSIFQPTSEVFDPATLAWKLSGIMSSGRDEFSGLLLDDGRVMISGGFVSPGAVLLRTVEVYTPGLVPQVNGLVNVLADTPNSALRFGKISRRLLEGWLYLMGYSVGKVDPEVVNLEVAEDLSRIFDAALVLHVRDAATRGRIKDINGVFARTLADRLDPNAPPTVAPTAAPQAGVEPLSVAFTGNALDPDGTIVYTLWSFGDGTTSNEANPTHVYTCDGNYTASLEVVDDRGAVTSATVAVQVTSAGGPISYACDVQPVFNRSCTGCHGAARGLSLTTCENLQAGSSPRPRYVVTPGVKETSILWQRINDAARPMPPIGGLLPQSERDAIGAWIDSLDPLDPNYCD
jgi:hypothetical protein